MLKVAPSVFLLLSGVLAVSGDDISQSTVVEANLVDSCVVDFDPDANIDYFPTKYSKPVIKSYGDRDIFGEKFVPHNTTDFLDITYHNNYKIVTNSHQDPPKKYLLYQCGTEIPADVNTEDFDLVVSVPHQGGLALSETPQIPYIELLGLREKVIAYVGDSFYVTSPCLSHMLGDEASEEHSIETVHDYNSTIMEDLFEDFRDRNPDAIIVSGPSNNVVGDQVVVSSATQERTNVATFDWIGFFAAFYNMEGESNRITAQMQDSYDCSSDVAKSMAQPQRELDDDQPTIMWANHISWNDLGWSVGDCPTWDHSYYCEYASHCGATILNRPEGVGYNKTWGSPTVYWYLSDQEMLDMGKDADVLIYSGGDWEAMYESRKEIMDQMKAVQNKQVFDTLGQGASAWYEQRYAEYDVVGLDMCDVVGRAPTTGPKHVRRWFRNVFTEPIGSLGTCDVEGGEISQPYDPPQQECVRPVESAVESQEDEEEEELVGESDFQESLDSGASSLSFTGLVSALAVAYFM